MHSYRITTDSVVDLTPERMQELGVAFAPLGLTVGDAEILDDMRPGTYAFLMKSMQENKRATTSQATEASFYKIWTPILEAGEDILHICMASTVSGTINSAHIARRELLEQYPGRSIMILDTLCLSGGEAVMLEQAVDWKNGGCVLDACYKKLERLRHSIQQWFTLNDLTYARRGGRVNAALAAVATLLHIKPVMTLDAEGNIVTVEKVKGRRNSIKRLYEIFCEKIDTASRFVQITQAECMDEARSLARQIEERFPRLLVRIYTVGAVIGCHGGPGTLTLSFVGKMRRATY